MSLNLIGRASGVCHFLAISGFALAWGRVGRGPPGLGSLEAQDSACSGGGPGCKGRMPGRLKEEGGCRVLGGVVRGGRKETG